MSRIDRNARLLSPRTPKLKTTRPRPRCLDTTRPLSETNRPICLLDGIEYFSTQLRWAELSVGRIVCPPADMVMCLHGLYFASSFQWYFRMLSEYLFNVESTVLPESNWYNHFEIQCLHYCLSVRQQHSQLSNKYNVLQEAWYINNHLEGKILNLIITIGSTISWQIDSNVQKWISKPESKC